MRLSLHRLSRVALGLIVRYNSIPRKICTFGPLAGARVNNVRRWRVDVGNGTRTEVIHQILATRSSSRRQMTGAKERIRRRQRVMMKEAGFSVDKSKLVGC